jgi:hypothetical protein
MVTTGELSSMSAQIDDLMSRIAAMSTDPELTKREALRDQLDNAERALRNAKRAIDAARKLG